MSEVTTVGAPKFSKSEVHLKLGSIPTFELLGEVVTWDTGKDKHHLSTVISSLKESGLPENATRELEPRAAFNRAVRQMKRDEAIELVDEEGDILTFQLTAKSLVKDPSHTVEPEMIYSKQGYISLNKDTGKIHCKIPEIQIIAQKLLDEATVTKTGSDISSLTRKLFDTASIDLFPMRDRGAVYFVFSPHKDYITQVDTFLRKLGGRINRLPVPTGDHPTVADIVSKQLQSVVDEHMEAIDNLNVQSAKVSLEAIAARINESRVKVEAYSSCLLTHKEFLDQRLEDANEYLKSRVESLTNERKELPPDQLGVDKWNYKLGTDSAKLNACITTTPKSLKQLTEEAGLTKERGGHLRELVNKGLVVKSPDGYAVRKETV